MHDTVTGVVLAGGQGRRMGGVDKGLQLLRGRPMVAHVLERIAPQVDALLVNANQNLEAYAALGAPYAAHLVPDLLGDFAGPLAGLQAGLGAARTPLVMTVPCDSPFLPLDLVRRMRIALNANLAQVAVAKTGDRPHPVFAMVRADVRDNLEAFLAGGGRKVDAWYAALAVVEVPFDDQSSAFENINTREELRELERK